MNKNNIFPITIFEFNLEKTMLEDTLAKVKNLKWAKNVANSVSRDSLNLNPNFADFHTFLRQCLQKVNEELLSEGSIKFEKIVLTQSWANKTGKGQGHHEHCHPNSLISGIVFLTSHKSGHTYFAKEDLLRNVLWYNYTSYYRYQPEAGKVLLFPSPLIHGVEEMQEDETRYTISFNSFPTGKIGHFAAGMILETKEIDDSARSDDVE